jgi:hypothetical protein
MHQTRTQTGSIITPRLALISAVALMLAIILPAGPAAAQNESSSGSTGGLHRIEISLSGGWFGGVTYLDLPPIAPDANDLGARDILDFSGIPLGRPKYPAQIDAAQKTVEDGFYGGVGATFFMSPTFGIELAVAYGVSQASVTGQYRDQQNLPEEDPTPGRFEWDRTDMSWISGGANMLYVFSPERKLRPFVQLGLGGILNRFPTADDVGGLYVEFGAGLRVQVSPKMDVKFQVQSSIFTWDQNEVDRNETVMYPAASVGLVWKYEVPDEPVESPAPESTDAGQGNATQGSNGGS